MLWAMWCVHEERVVHPWSTCPHIQRRRRKRFRCAEAPGAVMKNMPKAWSGQSFWALFHVRTHCVGASSVCRGQQLRGARHKPTRKSLHQNCHVSVGATSGVRLMPWADWRRARRRKKKIPFQMGGKGGGERGSAGWCAGLGVWSWWLLLAAPSWLVLLLGCACGVVVVESFREKPRT